MKKSISVCLLSVLSFAAPAWAAVTVLTGDAAIAKIQAAIPGTNVTKFGINKSTVKWMTPMSGVDMAFLQVTDLYGVKDDINLVRIDYKKAKLKMKLVVNDSSNKRTSVVTKNNGALIGVSGTFYRAATGVLSYRTKVSGVIKNSESAGGGGLLFNDNDPYKLIHFTRGFDKARVFDHWDNALPSDCVLLDGKCTISPETSVSAGFPLLGVNEKTGVIYLIVIDGRRSVSRGINYYCSAQLMLACGCDGGYCLDGGGSTTLVVKNDLLPASKFSQVQWAQSDVSGYTIMNYTNSDGSTRGERAVKSQLLFLAGDEAEPIPSDSFFEFVQTDGTGGSEGQRVELDRRPTGNTSVEAVYSLMNKPSADTNQCLWCARSDGEIRNEFSFFPSAAQYQRLDYGTVRNNTKSGLLANTIYRLQVTDNVMSNFYFDAGNLQKAFTATAMDPFIAGGPISLFMSYASPGVGWGEAAAMEFRSMRLADRIGGKSFPFAHLVGYYREGRYGLYDGVSDTFYPSTGTRDFVGQEWSLVRPGSSLTISGTPVCVPTTTMSPAYGVTNWLAKGAKISVKVSTNKFTVISGMSAQCTGWKLTQDGVTTDKPCKFTYTHGDTDARLVAQWNVRCRYQASSLDTTKGTVSASSNWKDYGSVITIKATPTEGNRFYGWKGDIGDADPTNSKLTLTMDRPRKVVADFGPEFVEWVEFPSGAFVKTGVIPTAHEVTAEFSCDCVNGAVLFGTTKGANACHFQYYGNAWTWGLNGTYHIANRFLGGNCGVWVPGWHSLVYREHGTGSLTFDGEVFEDVTSASSTTELMLGSYSSNANSAIFRGRVRSFRIRDETGAVVLDLRPCIRTLDDGTKVACFYDIVGNRYLESAVAEKPLVAGPSLSETLTVAGTPYEIGAVEGLVAYGKTDGLKKGDVRPLSAPAEIPFGTWAKARCLGWTRARLDAETGVWTDRASGDGNTLEYVHDGFPTRVTWRWEIVSQKTDSYVHVMPGGDDANKGTSWTDAYRTVQTAVDAAAPGSTVLVAPGHYYGTETNFNSKVDYLTCLRLAKDVTVLGIGGRERTLMDGGFLRPRNGAYLTSAGAFLAGFTFTNTACSASGRNLGVDLTGGAVSNISVHARAAASSTFLNINATVGKVRATDILLPPQPVLEGNVTGANFVNAIGAKGAEIDGLTLRDWRLGGLNLNYSMINLKGSAATAPIVLRNALVADNRIGVDINASRAHAVYADAHSRVINCTIVNNTVYGPSSGLRIAANTALVENCIIRGNRSATGTYGDINGNSNVARVFTSLCNQLDIVTKGNPNGNFNGDPNFVDEANGDYRLIAASRLVDAGGEKDGDIALLGNVDLAGASRIAGAAVDLGCYEHQTSSALSVGFESSVSAAVVGRALSLVFTGRVAGGSGAVSAVWDFGDGTTATGWPSVDHSYAQPGVYTVSLTVTRGGETVTRTVEGAATVLPDVCYVRAGVGTGIWPYDSWEKATDDVAAAVEVGSRRVLVGPGTYTLPTPYVTLARAVELVSLEGPEKTVLDSPKSDTSCVHRHFTICHADARVSGFTLTGGYTSSSLKAPFAGCVDLSAGMVENCIFRDNGQISAGQIVNIWGSGRLVGCELDGRGVPVHNYNYNSSSAIYLTGNAVVDGCWIHGYQIRSAYNDQTAFGFMAPIVLNGATAVLRNSLVTACTNAVDTTTFSTNYSGVVQIANGRVENCTIADNFVAGFGAVRFTLANNKTFVTKGTLVNTILSGNVSLGGAPDFYCREAGALVSNVCASSFAWIPAACVDATTCFAGAPGYATGADVEPYSLAETSPCVDAGQELAWMASGRDLIGNPRKAGSKVDIGCLEYGSSETRYQMDEVSDDGKVTNKVEMTAEAVVARIGGASYGETFVLNKKLEETVEIRLVPGVGVTFAPGQDMTKISFTKPSAYYRDPVVSGGRVLPPELDPEEVMPSIEGDGDEPAFAMENGRMTLNVSNVKRGLRYTLLSATSPAGPWSPVLIKYGTAGDDLGFSAETTAPGCFYRVSVTDLP